MTTHATGATRPAHTRAMNIAHAAMRRELVRAQHVLAVPEALTPGRRQALGEELVWFVGYIHHHHRGEDRELYPRLLALDPDLHDLVAAMCAEHESILPGLDLLQDVAAGFGSGETTEGELRDAILVLERHLLPHLDQEEREAMPEVARLMTQDEWDQLIQRAWVQGVSKPALGRLGLWILDGQPAEDAALMEAELPKAEVALLKLIFGPGHRRRSRRLWDGTGAVGVPALSAAARSALGTIDH